MSLSMEICLKHLRDTSCRLGKVSILLELRFERNANIYETSSFKDFENVVFFPNSFSGKRLDYSLLVKNDQ